MLFSFAHVMFDPILPHVLDKFRFRSGLFGRPVRCEVLRNSVITNELSERQTRARLLLHRVRFDEIRFVCKDLSTCVVG